jgi:hypothetical protein
MDHTLRSKIAFCVLAAASTGALYAQTAKTAAGPSSGPCQEVQSACSSAGFVIHGESEGKGLYADCMSPLLEGKAAPKGAKLALPKVDEKTLETCRADWKAHQAKKE